jgi:hypothetical protein
MQNVVVLHNPRAELNATRRTVVGADSEGAFKLLGKNRIDLKCSYVDGMESVIAVARLMNERGR